MVHDLSDRSEVVFDDERVVVNAGIVLAVTLGRRLGLERQRQLAASGSRLGTARADAFRTRREQRARALGYVSLEDFYRRRYRDQHARVDELAAELACAYSAVRGDLERFGLGPEGARARRARGR